jgi:hypothetical protein
MNKTLIAIAACLPLIACAGAPVADPNYIAYVQGEVAKAQEQSKAETSRLLALTAIAQSGDDRVKDRAISELQASRVGVGAPSIAQPLPRPNEALQWAQVILNPLASLAGIAINEAGAVKRAEQATAQQAITFGTINGIAQGGYALGAAGIAKLPTVTLVPAPVVVEGPGSNPDGLDPAPDTDPSLGQ